MKLTPEQIEENYNKFRSLVSKIDQDRQETSYKIIDHFADRLALAPASAKLSHHNAFPGGLILHSLNVLKNALNLRKSLSVVVPVESVVLCSMFHDIGKVGDINNDYYLTQDSDWHFKRGDTYKYNESLKYMTHTHRSLHLLQHFGLRLSEDEYLAILLHDGQYVDANKSYGMKEPNLALLLHWADLHAAMTEKEEMNANSSRP